MQIIQLSCKRQSSLFNMSGYWLFAVFLADWTGKSSTPFEVSAERPRSLTPGLADAWLRSDERAIVQFCPLTRDLLQV